MILYAFANEGIIKLVDNYLLSEPAWNFEIKKVYNFDSPILYKSVKPSGELYVGFVMLPAKLGF